MGMILFNLRCSSDHEFESWFKDGAAYDALVKAGEIACPVCGDTQVSKAIMAPRVSTAAKRDGRPKPSPAQMRQQYVSAMREVRRHVEDNCDYVGENFADEARKIHSGDAEERGIYGEATDAEAEALREEGVPFGRVPWVPREDA